MKPGRKEFYALLQKFERAFRDVDFTHRGVNYYPIIRIQYAYQVYITNISGIPGQLGTNSVGRCRLKPGKIIYYYLLDSLKTFKQHIKKQNTCNLLVVGVKAHETDTLLSENGEVRSQFLTPFEYFFNEAGIKFDRENFDTIRQNDRYKKIVFSFSFKQYLIKNSFARNSKLIRNLEKVELFSKENNFEFKGLAVSLLENLMENEIQYRQWKLLLKNSSYRKILSYCYYDNRVMALNRAANDLNLITIEYQHSQQSDDHFAYSEWTLNIKNTVNHFPSIFWVWTSADKKRIENSFTENFPSIQSVIGGNVYLSLLYEKYSSRNNGSNAVLVILQGAWIPSYIEASIAELPGVKWYFRLHPRYPADKLKMEQFHAKYPDRIEIKEANSLQLYELFGKVQYLLTSYSGAALEAQAFAIQNIIFSEDGYKSFREYIEKGAFLFINNAEELIGIVKQKRAFCKTYNEVLIDKNKIMENVVELF